MTISKSFYNLKFMEIKWYGHASFRISSKNGLSIITDPYTPERIGYRPFTEEADIVIVSSDNDPAHCRADLIKGDPEVVVALDVARKGGSIRTKSLDICAMEVMEAYNHPSGNPDPNGMYKFTLDGITVSHMGDAGNPLTGGQLEFLKGTHVLFALAGGFPTILMPDLKNVITEVKPNIVIPMHFRTLRCKIVYMNWITNFISLFEEDKVDFAFQESVTLLPEDLPDPTRALILDYA